MAEPIYCAPQDTLRLMETGELMQIGSVRSNVTKWGRDENGTLRIVEMYSEEHGVREYLVGGPGA